MKSKEIENEDFLPAALEILETPPSPIGRILSIFIGFMFVAVIVWAILGKVDVIVTGQGKIVPLGQVKTVQAPETGVAVAINVTDGMQVIAGQTLLELDPAETISSLATFQEQLEEALLDLASAEALLTNDPKISFAAPSEVSSEKTALAIDQTLSIFDAHQATLLELSEERERLASDLIALKIEIEKISDTLPIVEARLAASGSLLKRDAISEDTKLSLKQVHIEMLSAKNTHLNSVERMEAAMRSIDAREQRIASSFEAEQKTRVRETQNRISELNNLKTLEEKRHLYRSLKSPVDGFVDQLSVHTIGGVVNAGDTVMHIVPSNVSKEIEAFILNKDVGFVAAGDPVEIKLEAYPFTKYGVLEGKVLSVSNDAIAHEQFGLVYKVRARITTVPEQINKVGISVAPGMNATLEILTEQRRIIEYFISPLLRYKDEAIRER